MHGRGKCKTIKRKTTPIRESYKKRPAGGSSTGGAIRKAGEFNGDLRNLPKTPQKPQATAPVRESGDKPKVLPTPVKTPKN